LSRPNDFPGVHYQINTYGSDQTLLFYRQTTEPLLHLLLPHHTAQALHIVPYPSEGDGSQESQERILKEQIFNSWWNGYLLGYPDFMIDSYCHSFHSELSDEDKRREALRAKTFTLNYFAEAKGREDRGGGRVVRKGIQIGNEENLMTDSLARWLSKSGAV
jgi:hypothetical protein